jgi:hypothetical protein
MPRKIREAYQTEITLQKNGSIEDLKNIADGRRKKEPDNMQSWLLLIHFQRMLSGKRRFDEYRQCPLSDVQANHPGRLFEAAYIRGFHQGLLTTAWSAPLAMQFRSQLHLRKSSPFLLLRSRSYSLRYRRKQCGQPYVISTIRMVIIWR